MREGFTLKLHTCKLRILSSFTYFLQIWYLGNISLENTALFELLHSHFYSPRTFSDSAHGWSEASGERLLLPLMDGSRA